MFKQEQIKELLSNENVVRCSATNITYKEKFKVWAISKYLEEGYSPNEIFAEAGFNVSIIGKNKAKDCLFRWRRTMNKEGLKGLVENRGKLGGRKAKLQFKNKDKKIEYLETKIAYLNAENDFLAKLRGLKRRKTE
ncbi:MAG: hypothetical protein AUJ23_02065 [Candidatus Magasanikbacteria bacterium CG1_02_32_51]|uniref:Transposase n=1 Tax=Candidatus Magasanikbacteria bacterium CG1_02_32_51 TaxID=1805238 RepID=A0A1J4U4F4_9BACT|nr:MAG: hypothetical protein AUJ23_02065 [Candidatus Magasanikbacteria bacterium CG1_02_32_51]